MKHLVVAAFILLAHAPSLAQESAAPPPTAAAGVPQEAPPAVELPAWVTSITVGGFVDVYGALNLNFPEDHVSFNSCCGSTAKRANEFALNLAGLDVTVPAAPVGAKLQLVVGNATELIHSGEPVGTAVGPGAFNPIYQAYVSVAPPFIEGLTLDAGVFASHLGFEAFLSNANWNYTRGWLSETVPWYQAGVRAVYATPFLTGLTLQLHVLNGWQIIADNNDAKSFGASVGYSNDLISASLNGWAGSELAGDDDHWRFLGDSIVSIHPISWLQIAASADLGHQQLDPEGATWWGVAVHARVSPLDWLAFAVRVETFDDPDNGISGAAQQLTSETVTVELKPVSALSVKVEGRFDQSSAEVFSAGAGDTAATQTLFLVGAVASF